MLKSKSTVAILSSCVVLATVASACSSREEDRIGADVEVINKTSSALTGGDISVVYGTYGTDCIGHSSDGTDTWVFDRETPANTNLAVVKNDSSCILSVTGVESPYGTFLASPALALTTADTYLPNASAFALSGQPVRFFGNAKISERSYANDFTITVLVSDFTSEDSASKGASYAMRSSSLSTPTVLAPNYGVGLADFGILKDSDNVVDSVNGKAVLVDAEQDPATGEEYAIVSGALDANDPADDIALAFDEAQTSGVISGPGTELAASLFGLVGEDLDASPERTIIIRHTVSDVSAYQLIVLTFHP